MDFEDLKKFARGLKLAWTPILVNGTSRPIPTIPETLRTWQGLFKPFSQLLFLHWCQHLPGRKISLVQALRKRQPGIKQDIKNQVSKNSL